jgi:hypothetical protein
MHRLRELGRATCQGRLLPFLSRCSGFIGKRNFTEDGGEGGKQGEDFVTAGPFESLQN